MRKVIFMYFMLIVHIAALCQDEGKWLPVTARIMGDVTCIYTNDTNIYISGAFKKIITPIDTIAVSNFAGRDETGNWYRLSGEPAGLAYSINLYNNKLYWGGSGAFIGVHYYEDTSWNVTGIDPPNSIVYTLAKHNNILYAGGGFIDATHGRDILSWNDTVWSSVGGGMGYAGTDHVDCMIAGIINGKYRLFVGGSFEVAGYNTPGEVDALNLAQWDGQSWDSVSSVYGQQVNAMTIDTINEHLYISGGFTKVDTVNTVGIAMWDGNKWYPVGEAIDCEAYRNGLLIYHGELYLGGCITQAANTNVRYIARWNGREWKDVGGGANSAIEALAIYKDTLYVGGYFETVGTNDDTSIALAKWYTPPCAYLKAGIKAESAGSGNVVFSDSSAGLWKSSWWWDFGDGATDTVQNPIHHYTQEDTYLVTLVVGYDYPDGTQCRDTAYRTLSVTGIPETIPSKPSLTILPNPSHGTLTVTANFTHKPKNARLLMVNVAGQEVKQYTLDKMSNVIAINTKTLAKGVYLFTVKENGKKVMVEKAIVE